MPSEEFLAELSRLHLIDWECTLIKMAGSFPGGPTTAREFANAVYAKLMPVEEESATIALERVGAFLGRIGAPPPMLVQETLPERSLILLTGKPKHGKSFTALDLAD